MATARKGEASLDKWSLVHLASGFALGMAGVSVFVVAGLLIAYESFEMNLREIKTEEGGLFEFESSKNILADVFVGLAGYALGRLCKFRFL